ncbi:hypothetical protein TNCV_4911751 [Trichonephila clavipes]|nr:hypothetical protein TNCV_4911751 [Trichonephila clavipes]
MCTESITKNKGLEESEGCGYTILNLGGTENSQALYLGGVGGGPVAWPPRSPDLSPLDFFLWGAMKGLVYDTPVVSEMDPGRMDFHRCC